MSAITILVQNLYPQKRRSVTKMFLGYWLLASGYWLLATGYWLLATGHWLLANGYWLLATGYLTVLYPGRSLAPSSQEQ